MGQEAEASEGVALAEHQTKGFFRNLKTVADIAEHVRLYDQIVVVEGDHAFQALTINRALKECNRRLTLYDSYTFELTLEFTPQSFSKLGKGGAMDHWVRQRLLPDVGNY